jgi:6-pyruvoyltetrahydropterin/6-carboxytetrahydropterin synthase
MYAQIEDSFEAAHHLPSYEGKCSRVHGHRWVVKAAWEGVADEATGMICDFKVLKEALHSTLERFDHQDLNYYFNDPTAEYVAEEVFRILRTRKISSLTLAYVVVAETPGCQVMFNEKDYGCCGVHSKPEYALAES